MDIVKRVSHWTPRYIVARSKNIVYQYINSDHPWLTPDAIRFLDSWLLQTDVGLEFGSGRSTLWFAKHAMKLISMENDELWFIKVSKLLKDNDCNNVDYHYSPLEHTIDKNQIGYVSITETIDDSSLDFALVDGAWRSACALNTISKIKPGGILIIDNVNWALPSSSRAPSSRSLDQSPVDNEWTDFYEKVSGWRVYWTSNDVTDTAIFFKPQNIY